ncbi:type I secretion C-terminal target domain-containing protein [Rubellicoccus peritrichatus]|uniref:Type I secretion C-terminal target domain-containing protein n=1 Tax=Rubellicoccus peritrichatus TaxID=3080537 RepID=A0AAQ3LD95_9BACT|nr:type I secretion C-terminal target domain-containing protein [Puniceicoccus sp. CR14]WOO43595.1 type I secretion C-terminal target domain-containing protein [Puniceicoccus sp. CR14]
MKFRTSILLLFALNTVDAGIPEPDFLIYGKIIDTGAGQPIEVDEGQLRWSMNSEGDDLTFETEVRVFGEETTFSYIITIPAETGFSEFLAETEIDLGDQAEHLSSWTIELDYNGATYPVTVDRSFSNRIQLSQGTRGRSFRIDLDVHLPVIDTDGDGLPDFYEDQYDELDKLVADATLDADGDLISNYDEFLQNTDPSLASTAPEILSTRLMAPLSGISMLRIDVADLDDNPKIDTENPSFTNADSLSYTLLDLESSFTLLKFNSSSAGNNEPAAFEVMSLGDTFSHADLLQGKVLLQHDGNSINDGFIQLNLTDGLNPAIDVTLPIIVWSPDGPDGEEITEWIYPLAGQYSVFGESVASTPLDGQPALLFSGDKFYSQPTAEWMGNGDWQILAVVNSSSVANQGLLATPNGALNLITGDDLQFPGHVRLAGTLGGAISEHATDSMLFVDASRKNQAIRLATNNSSRDRSFGLDETPALPSQDLLGKDAAGNYFEGGLHELIVFPDTLNPVALAEAMAYLKARWKDCIVVDALQSNHYFFGSAPSSQLSNEDYEQQFVTNFGFETSHLLLAWNRNVAFWGGHADDEFWFGGGAGWVRGGGGADRFVLVQTGAEQEIVDFDEASGDVLDLQYLFDAVSSGEINDYIKINPEGGDAVVSVFTNGDPTTQPEALIRLTGRADLNQSQLPILYAIGALNAGGLRPALDLSITSIDPEAVEVDEKPASIDIIATGQGLAANKHLHLDIDTTMTLGEDFELMAEVYDDDLGEYQTVSLNDYRIPVSLAPADDQIRFWVQPIANQITQEARQLSISLVDQAGRYSLAQDTDTLQVSLIDGLPYLLIEPSINELDPTVAGEGFRVTRVGATDTPLTFQVSLEGTAINGTDYTYISSEQTFSAGAEETLVPVNALRYALSENANIVAMRLTPQTHYQLKAPSVADIALKTEVVVINLDAIQAKAILDDAQPEARFFLQLSGPQTNQVTMVPLLFNGTANLRDYQIISVSPSGFETPVSVDSVSRTGNIFLLPGESYCIIKMIPNSNVNLAGAGKTVDISLDTPFNGAKYENGTRNRVMLFIVGDFETWATAQNDGIPVTDLETWALQKAHSAGLPNLIAYALGLAPEEAMHKDANIEIQPTGNGELEFWVPYYDGVSGIDLYLQETDDLDLAWKQMQSLSLDRIETKNEQRFRVYKGSLSTQETLFIRQVAEVVPN